MPFAHTDKIMAIGNTRRKTEHPVESPFGTLDSHLAQSQPRQFIDGLLDYVTNPNLGGVGPEDLQQAPPMIKAAIFVNAFDSATANAGVWEWFVELHDDYPKIDALFKKIHAPRSAAYIAAAKALFPKGRVPKNADLRFEFCDEHGREFHQIDQRFKGASEEALAKLRDYLASHRKAFEAQVKTFWEIRKANKRLSERRLEKLRRKELGK